MMSGFENVFCKWSTISCVPGKRRIPKEKAKERNVRNAGRRGIRVQLKSSIVHNSLTKHLVFERSQDIFFAFSLWPGIFFEEPSDLFTQTWFGLDVRENQFFLSDPRWYTLTFLSKIRILGLDISLSLKEWVPLQGGRWMKFSLGLTLLNQNSLHPASYRTWAWRNI